MSWYRDLYLGLVTIGLRHMNGRMQFLAHDPLLGCQSATADLGPARDYLSPEV
jgi:hypothetical protein